MRAFGALCALVLRGQTQAVLAELPSLPDPNLQLPGGQSLLHLAAKVPYSEVLLDALALRGAAMDLQDQVGTTAAMVAADHGRASNLQRLLEHGADPLLEDDHRRTALHLAAAARRTACVRVLLAHGVPPDGADPTNPPLLACIGSKEDLAVESLLLAYGADPQAGPYPDAALKLALAYENTELAKLLISQG